MRILVKVVALLLSGCLLTPHLLLAQETLQEPIALQDLQQKAKIDAAVLKKAGISVGATAAFGGIFAAVRHILKQKAEIKTLQAQLAQLQTSATAVPISTAKPVTSAATDVEKMKQRILRQRDYYEHIISLRDKQLETIQQQTAKQKSAAEEYLAGSVSISERESAFLDKCADLLLEPNPKEQAIYREAIYHDRVFTRMSASEQAKFRSTLEELVRAVRTHQPLGAETYQVLGRMILRDTNIPATQRLARGIGSILIKKSSSAVFVIALLTVGVITADAQTHPHTTQEASRILNDITIFLNATPAQLQYMQSNPILYDACLQVTQTLDLLANHTAAEDLQLLKQDLSKHTLHLIQETPLAR